MEFKELLSQADTSISAYGDGGFRFGDQRSKGSILITPRGFYPWEVTDSGTITMESLKSIVDQQDDIDILLIGTGDNMAFLTKELRISLEAENIAVDVMSTGAAARTYNVLLAEGRKVAAALIAVK